MGLPGFDKGLLAQQPGQDSCMAPHMDTDPSMHNSAGDMHSAGEFMGTGFVTCIRQVSPCAPAPSHGFGR